MPAFVIAGMPDCNHFVHALHVGRHLQAKLPDMKLSVIELDKEEWAHFLVETNRKNGWHHTTSPIIWKEVAMRGGRPHLIGGLSEFWEYCDDYYKLQAYLNKNLIDSLTKENIRRFQEQNMKEKEMRDNRLNISIYGIMSKVGNLILNELLSIPALKKTEMLIKIFDPDLNNDNLNYLLNFLNEIRGAYVTSVKYVIEIEDCLSHCLKNCDVFIIAEDFSKRPDEDVDKWLIRCCFHMKVLASEIDCNCTFKTRIVFCHLGPVCFNASILVGHCHAVKVSNIVAVTAQEGYKCLRIVSARTQTPIHKMGAPPVWGLVGNDYFVDVHGIIVEKDIVRPYNRALKNKGSSTLPLGKITKEYKLLLCGIDQDVVNQDLRDRDAHYKEKRINLIFPLLRAFSSLMNLWFSKEFRPDSIISLGIVSNGSFGIPVGMVFSQPASLNDRKMWYPFRNYPIEKTSMDYVQKSIEAACSIMEPFLEKEADSPPGL